MKNIINKQLLTFYKSILNVFIVLTHPWQPMQHPLTHPLGPLCSFRHSVRPAKMRPGLCPIPGLLIVSNARLLLAWVSCWRISWGLKVLRETYWSYRTICMGNQNQSSARKMFTIRNLPATAPVCGTAEDVRDSWRSCSTFSSLS